MPDKILVIDDEPEILELLKINLTADGFEVITASSGQEALVKVKQGVFYTDGIIESENLSGELFGEERLIEVIQNYADLSANEICEHIEGSLVEFSGTQQRLDDTTIVVLRVKK